MALLTELKALIARRGEHESAIAAIDQDINEARDLLGLDRLASTPYPEKPWRTQKQRASFPRRARIEVKRERGLTEDRIIEALTARPLQTGNELQIAIPDVSTVKQHLVRLKKEGAIVGRRRDSATFYYALTEEAFQAWGDDDGDTVEGQHGSTVPDGSTVEQARSIPITTTAVIPLRSAESSQPRRDSASSPQHDNGIMTTG